MESGKTSYEMVGEVRQQHGYSQYMTGIGAHCEQVLMAASPIV
jgi:hypothetical protein